jgi:mannosyltransferase
MVFLSLSVPVIGSFLVSFVRPIFYPRYLFFAMPFLCTLAGLGVGQLSSKAWRAVAIVGFVALSCRPLVAYYRAPFKEGEDWRGAVAYVASEQQSGDGIVFLSRLGHRPFEYYLDRTTARDEIIPIYPHSPWGSYTPVLADVQTESTSVAAAHLQSCERVWVILLWGGFHNPHQQSRPIKDVLERQFEEVTSRGFGEMLDVRLYQQVTTMKPPEGQGGR